MIEIDFKKIELEDKDLITHYFKHHTSRSCERTFVNVYLWARFYHVKFAEVEHTLVFRTEDEDGFSFAYPAGESIGCADGIQQGAGSSVPHVYCDTG